MAGKYLSSPGNNRIAVNTWTCGFASNGILGGKKTVSGKDVSGGRIFNGNKAV
jgi:hypothetical protein